MTAKISLLTIFCINLFFIISDSDKAIDDYIIRRCSADNTQTTCRTSLVGRFRTTAISQYDIAFDFDNPSICSNDNNVPTSAVPITQDSNQGPIGLNDPDYNVIQTNLNCFGGFRGIQPSCENDYTVWFPGEGSDNGNNIDGARVETSAFPTRPCYITDGCPSDSTNGDDPAIAYTFSAQSDYICANLNDEGFFEFETIFMTTCSLSSIDGKVGANDLSANTARVEELESDTFSGTKVKKTLKYGSFLDEDCSFGLPDPNYFDIDKDCIAGIVEHHASMRSDDYILVVNGVNDIYVEFRADTNFKFNFRNRVKVKFLCGKFKDIKYKAYRCKYKGAANDEGDGGSLRYHEFTKNDCAELKNVDSIRNDVTSERANLGPKGNECLAFLRRYRQCGDDYSYRVINEGSNFGPGVAWELDDNTCGDICPNEVNCGDVDIEVDFLCPQTE